MSVNRPTVLTSFIGQTQTVKNLQIAVVSAKRQNRALGHVIFAGPAGVGKCLGAGTPVLLADGRVLPVELVLPGDRLMGPDGSARNVLSVCNGHAPLYRIQPVKGEAWTCNDVHVLSLVRSETGRIIDIPLDQWQTASKTFRSMHKQISVGVDSFEGALAERPVDPYFLGVWFGDGTKALRDGVLVNVAVTKPDTEIKAVCEQIAAQWGLSVRVYNSTGCPTYSITGVRVGDNRGSNRLLTAMRDLLGATLDIPEQYLRAPRRERLEFLAGILDADGSLTQGCFDIAQKREDWAHAVWWLARSLGLCATRTKRKGRCRLSDGSMFEGIYWRVCISGNTDQIPTRIPRKQAAQRRQQKTATHTGFSATAIGTGAYYGFTLDGDGRFLLGDFTVTHNTTLGMSVIPTAMGVTSRYVNCAAIEKPPELTVVLASMGENQILFLDELHALPVAAREHLLTAMEDRRVSVKIDDQKIINVDLPAFTVIGATTRIGLLDGPLRSRFQHRFTLTPYSQDETAQIVTWHARAREFVPTVDAAQTLATAAQGVAREAVNLVEACVDTYMSVSAPGNGQVLSNDMAKDTVDRLGYRHGFSADQLRYLAALSVDRPLGLKQLESILNEQACTIEDVLEPWLLRNRYIEITPQGRKLTNSLDAGTNRVPA